MPFTTRCHGWQGDIAYINQRTIFWIWPWNTTIQIAHYLPLRKQLLNEGGILQLEWREDKAIGEQCRKAIHGIRS